jgi:SAM-dependent methyltransferase
MTPGRAADTWEQGDPYERYIGRWSRGIAAPFLAWLDRPGGQRWLDVGCGTGALSAAILERASPKSLVGVEPSTGFLELAARHLGGRASLRAGSAAALPVESRTCDVVVSGLVLNFVADLPAAMSEMRRVTVPGGTVAAYVWDYADRMEIIRHFWDAAASLDHAAAQGHEAARFPLCHPSALRSAFEQAGLVEVETTSLELSAEFADFEDYWQPFLGGQGPAPAYAMSLPPARRAALRARLQSALPAAAGGALTLRAGAWAVRGVSRSDARGASDAR